MLRSWQVVFRWLSKVGAYVGFALLGLIAFIGFYGDPPWYVTVLVYLAAISCFGVHFVKNWDNRS